METSGNSDAGKESLAVSSVFARRKKRIIWQTRLLLVGFIFLGIVLALWVFVRLQVAERDSLSDEGMRLCSDSVDYIQSELTGITYSYENVVSLWSILAFQDPSLRNFRSILMASGISKWSVISVGYIPIVLGSQRAAWELQYNQTIRYSNGSVDRTQVFHMPVLYEQPGSRFAGWDVIESPDILLAIEISRRTGMQQLIPIGILPNGQAVTMIFYPIFNASSTIEVLKGSHDVYLG